MKASRLAARARRSPACAGVYRLYRAGRLLHVGMAAGGATVRSELLAHARGEYGASTRQADRVEWEVARDPLFAYQRFLTLYSSAIYDAAGAVSGSGTPSRSGRWVEV